MSIKIKKSKKGTLHDALDIPRDEKIPASKLKVKSSDSPSLKKKKQFAINAKKWKHADYGDTIPMENPYMFGTNRRPNIPLQLTNDIPAELLPIERTPIQYNNTLMKNSAPQNIPLELSKGKKNKGVDGDAILAGLMIADALIPGEANRRRYLRPEEMTPYNPLQYGNGSQAIAEKGMTVPKKGKLKAQWGGNVEQASYNPYDGGTMQFNGASHDDGGIGITYGNKPVEVEGGESAFVSQNGNLNIMGKLKVPGTNKTFKSMLKDISKQEAKTASSMEKSIDLINTADPKDKYEMLKFNSGKVMLEGGIAKQKELANTKQKLSNMQSAILEMYQEPNKARYGNTVPLYAEGGTVEVDANGDPIDDKYAAMEKNALAKLQAMFPGRNVKIVVDESFGKKGARPLSTQRGIKGSGFSKTDVSLHNFGGARDYKIYIDGKYVTGKAKGDADIYRNTLWPAAKETGLYTASDWSDKSDLGHVGLVQESRKGRNKAGVFTDLFTKYPELKNSDSFKQSFADLSTKVKSGVATGQERNAYRQVTGDKTNYKTVKADYNRETKNLGLKKGQKLYNEMLVQAPDLENVPTPYTGPLSDLPDYNNPNLQQSPYNPQRVAANPGKVQITNPPKYPRSHNSENLAFNQILPEALTLATNTQDPVKAQLFYPELYQPYSVSFQDRINENNAQFNAIEKQLAYDPTALSSLAPQLYQANNAVQADEFRTNQGIFNDVNNKNIGLLNSAQGTNLGILDQQYVRQTQAQANTRRQGFEAISSISNKYAQNQLNNRTLNVYENMYPHYTFDQSNSFEAVKEGAPGAEYINWGPNTQQQPPVKTEETYGPNNTIKQIKKTYVPPTQQDFMKMLRSQLTQKYNK